MEYSVFLCSVLKVNMVLNIHRNCKCEAYQSWGEGEEGGMEVGEKGKMGGERKLSHITAPSPPRMTPALRWSAMRTISMFH